MIAIFSSQCTTKWPHAAMSTSAQHRYADFKAVLLSQFPVSFLLTHVFLQWKPAIPFVYIKTFVPITEVQRLSTQSQNYMNTGNLYGLASLPMASHYAIDVATRTHCNPDIYNVIVSCCEPNQLLYSESVQINSHSDNIWCSVLVKKGYLGLF